MNTNDAQCDKIGRIWAVNTSRIRDKISVLRCVCTTALTIWHHKAGCIIGMQSAEFRIVTPY